MYHHIENLAAAKRYHFPRRKNSTDPHIVLSKAPCAKTLLVFAQEKPKFLVQSQNQKCYPKDDFGITIFHRSLGLILFSILLE